MNHERFFGYINCQWVEPMIYNTTCWRVTVAPSCCFWMALTLSTSLATSWKIRISISTIKSFMNIEHVEIDPGKWFTTSHKKPFLLTWFNFDPSMDKQLHPSSNETWKYISVPSLQWCSHWSLGMDKSFHLTFYWTCYLPMLGLKLIRVSKRGPCLLGSSQIQDKIQNVNISFMIFKKFNMLRVKLGL